MTKFTVVDSIMGSGKSSWAIEHIRKTNYATPFIVITPFLDEVERYINECAANGGKRRFQQPQANGYETKTDDFLRMIRNGEDIVSTHSLFQLAGTEFIEAIRDNQYEIIIDEAIDFLDISGEISISDVELLQDQGIIRINEESGIVEWLDFGYDGKFNAIKEVALTECLYVSKPSKHEPRKTFVWEYNPKILSAFQSVTIMTYLFEGTTAFNYFEINGFRFEKASIRKIDGAYSKVEYDRRLENREYWRSLILLDDSKERNSIAPKRTDLSINQMKAVRNKGEFFGQISTYIDSFFKNTAKAKANEVYYSTAKEFEHWLQPPNYTRNEPKPFRKLSVGLKRKYKTEEEYEKHLKSVAQKIPNNARATNQYGSRKAVALVYNYFPNPNMVNYVAERGSTLSQDTYAVGILLQWLWRSRIRNGEEIHAYIPSDRMRQLLEAWANYEI